jgi:hypothetical protein
LLNLVETVIIDPMEKGSLSHAKANGFGTGPVFFTAVSTILGAILFLRFGFAVGTLGFWGAILLVLLGHLITIPTALAISAAYDKPALTGRQNQPTELPPA